MASPVLAVGKTKELILQWKIEKEWDSYRLFKEITSPAFVDGFKGTRWTMLLRPIGNQVKEDIGLYIHRETDSSGPAVITAVIQIAILSKNGSLLKERTGKFSFEKGDSHGFSDFENRSRLFVTEKEAFLPGDTLTIQCTIWSFKKTSVKTQHLHARSVFKLYRRPFVWRIDKFSAHYPVSRHKLKIGFVDFDLVLNEETGFETKIIMNINSLDERMKYFSFSTSILDSEGKIKSYETKEYFINDLKNAVLSYLLIFPEKMMEKCDHYLPNDVLSLICEYVYVIENAWVSVDNGPIAQNEEVQKEDGGKLKLQNPAVLVHDLKSMYSDALLYDTELRTLTRTFPAHQAILSARSPVFSKMFSSNMKEKNTGLVEITDLEDDTMRRMLLYIYTDSMEDLQFESTFKLYSAADKYEILSLKGKCSYLLRNSFSSTNVCDVLTLAELYQDKELKNAAEAFILKHDEVFNSMEWKHFKDCDVKLAADIMYKKILNVSIVETNKDTTVSSPKIAKI